MRAETAVSTERASRVETAVRAQTTVKVERRQTAMILETRNGACGDEGGHEGHRPAEVAVVGKCNGDLHDTGLAAHCCHHLRLDPDSRRHESDTHADGEPIPATQGVKGTI